MSALKRVADAISKADGHNPDYVTWVDYKDHARAAVESLRADVQRLILAADCYGVRYLDSDDMSEEAEELQAATEAMKDILAEIAQ